LLWPPFSIAVLLPNKSSSVLTRVSDINSVVSVETLGWHDNLYSRIARDNVNKSLDLWVLWFWSCVQKHESSFEWTRILSTVWTRQKRNLPKCWAACSISKEWEGMLSPSVQAGTFAASSPSMIDCFERLIL
jgi:hypothetical protein